MNAIVLGGSTRSDFDLAARRLAEAQTSLTERELLEATVWAFGEDGRLREDARFRDTPWGRWILAGRFLANETIVRELREGERAEIGWVERCAELSRHVGVEAVICVGDPRLSFAGERVRLAASELSGEPLLEEATPFEQYRTHLPVLTLEAAAASEPAGEWGPGARAQAVDALGWLRVDLDRPLNDRMFVARLRGASMDDGHSGLVDGAWVVFEHAFHRGVAYDSGRVQPNLLVRGAFHDSETGSYAIKRWDRDRKRVRLESLNPDRARYPDIVVKAGELDELRVIATALGPLAPSSFGRRPRLRRRPGTRALRSRADLRRLGEEAAARARTFFEAAPPPDDGEEREAPPARWQAALVCCAAEAGGPHLEVGPLVGLPRFVRRLVAKGPSWEHTLLASNVRSFALRERVDVWTGPWSWSAPGFEDELGADLAAMEVAAPDAEALTAFRVEADSIARRVGIVSPGAAYRFLVPPSHAVPEASPLGHGWALWEVGLEPGDRARLSRLAELGVAVGEAQLALAWSLPLPAGWMTSARGEDYACFALGTDPVAVVRGGAIVEADDAVAVLARVEDGEARTLRLEPGPRALVKLEGLGVGRYVLSALHRRVVVPPARLFFEVATNVDTFIDAAWSLACRGETVADGHRLDLGALDANDDDALVLRAPPGWPVAFSWTVLRRDYRGTRSAGADGELGTRALLAPIEERRRRESIGDFELDLAELGTVSLAHARQPSPAAVRAGVARIVEERHALFDGSAAYADLARLAVGPICEWLGYELGDTVGSPFDGPTTLAIWRLERTERGLLGMEHKTVRLLVLGDALDAMRTPAAAAFISQRCRAEGVRDAILVAGAAWTTHRVDSSPKPVFELTSVTESDEPWRAFVNAFGEGI
ncbi:MAG: hypothetical protein KF729_04560 [Sandaracinaceae bacterium]|nr:hypothetical protein [Sandaracinaceae bacterium]